MRMVRMMKIVKMTLLMIRRRCNSGQPVPAPGLKMMMMRMMMMMMRMRMMKPGRAYIF